MKQRPKLSVSIADSLRVAAERRGFLAYFPWVFATCLIIGFAAVNYIPVDFWHNTKWDVSTAVFAGLLAFNGLLMSLGWFAFSKIYEILANDQLGKRLTKYNLLGVHLAFIDVNHIILISSSLLSAIGLVSILIGMPIYIDKFLLGSCFGFTLYSMARAYSATNMVNDLIWEQAHLNTGEKPELTTVGGNGSSKTGA